MALQVCKQCGTRYAPAATCPHCGHDQWVSDYEAGEAAPAAPEPAPAARGVPLASAPAPRGAPQASAGTPGAPGKPVAAGEPPAPPPVNAPKADWVDHAVAVGVPQEEAEAKTKAELIKELREELASLEASAP